MLILLRAVVCVCVCVYLNVMVCECVCVLSLSGGAGPPECAVLSGAAVECCCNNWANKVRGTYAEAYKRPNISVQTGSKS